MAGALLETGRRVASEQVDGGSHGDVADGREVRAAPLPLDGAVVGGAQGGGPVGLGCEAAQLGELSLRGLLCVDLGQEDLIEQVPGFAGLDELLLVGWTARRRGRDQVIAASPKPEVGRTDQRVVGVGVAALLRRVDEVQRDGRRR
jgi:hypothetical protein